MSNLQLWALVVGFLTPPVLAIIEQSGWSKTIRSLVAFGAALLAGAGTAYFQGDLTSRRFIEASLVVLVAAISTYQGFWKPTGIAPAIEKATSVDSAP